MYCRCNMIVFLYYIVRRACLKHNCLEYYYYYQAIGIEVITCNIHDDVGDAYI